MATKSKKLNWIIPVLKGIAFFALGILIVNQPDETMFAILKTLGIALILIGAGISTFSYYVRKTLSNYISYLIMGVVLSIFGLIILFNPESSGRIIAIAFATAIGFSGVVNLIIALKVRGWGAPQWLWITLVSILELGIAAIFVFNPALAGLTIITVLGVGMIIFGLLNVLIGVNIKRTLNFVGKQELAVNIEATEVD